MSSVVFLNFGAEPQYAVGTCSIQELITDNSKMKKKKKNLAHDNFKLDETGGYFSKRVENTVEKGEIAPYEKISISHCVFKYFSSRNVKTRACLGNFLSFVGVIVKNQSRRS